MTSSYSTDLKIELMVTGENAGTWGDKTNDNLDVIEQAIAGFKAVSIAGGAQTTNLLINNSPDIATSDARNAVIKLTGTITGNQIVTVPTGITKTYIVQNGTTGVFTVEFKQAGGTGTTFSTTDKGIKILFADGTNINAVDLSTLSGTIATAQIADLAITSSKLASFAVTSARLASFAVTSARLASFAVTSAKLATNAVTGVKITQSTITQAKLAANSVGSNQLIATAVTPATYTAATITVDAGGRITAASSGSGGAGASVLKLYTTGPGTFTAAPTANRLMVYMYAGGGGAANNNSGGNGGGGFYNKPITQPFSQTFTVGSAGNPGVNTQTAGNAGGATTFTNVGTVNGGAGAPTNTTGASGNQPGSDITLGMGERDGPVNFSVGGRTTISPKWGVGALKPSNFMCGESAAFTSNPGALIVYDNTGT